MTKPVGSVILTLSHLLLMKYWHNPDETVYSSWAVASVVQQVGSGPLWCEWIAGTKVTACEDGTSLVINRVVDN